MLLSRVVKFDDDDAVGKFLLEAEFTVTATKEAYGVPMSPTLYDIECENLVLTPLEDAEWLSDFSPIHYSRFDNLPDYITSPIEQDLVEEYNS